jgi:hypothetical protein
MNRLRRLGKLAWALLRELADENAYQRRLETTGRPASPEEWRDFTDERYRDLSTRPKCC